MKLFAVLPKRLVARVAIHHGVAEGGKGTVDLANVVAEACDDVSNLEYTLRP